MEFHWVGMQEIEEAVRDHVEERLGRLAEGHSDLIDLRITGRTSEHHRHGDREVRITCQARGREIVAVRNCAELSLALNEAVDVFEREVHRLRERRRDRSRAASSR